jgi:hypothetical protein
MVKSGVPPLPPQQDPKAQGSPMKNLSELEYLADELHQMLRTRYGNLNLPQVVGVLELVKWELINDCQTEEPKTDEL